MKRVLVTSCAIVLVVACGLSYAAVDDFEDYGSIYQVVNTRTVEGVEVTISNDRDWPYLSVFYYDPNSPCFLGAADQINAPLTPALISGDVFISTADDINQDMPIVFDFSTPVEAFGLTTIDVLENVQTTEDAEVRLQGFRDGTLVAEHVITGIQGDSGVVLVWAISDINGIDQAQMILTAGSMSAGYGIDNLVVVAMPVATNQSTFGGVKALYR